REIIRERKVRPVRSTSQLVKVIQRAVPDKYQHQKIHFATRTFQALRIAVNQELESLAKVLPQTIEVLEHGGRVVVISFHSLEDRIVKNFFKDRASQRSEGEDENGVLIAKKASLKILTKKPIGPSQEEIRINPRSRSARLRAAEKI
ncbi:MAG: 16S rRNA (cytosine(1402)-N(4))-methyltransferase RsmH, partial [bacterium]|nr:16S rRNA (cytosine(1402)-N(4))-methyltransferase RsmH [bacterium]